MPLFKFKVSDAAGSISELLIEGDSQTDATRRVQRRGLMPLEFLGEGAKTAQSSGKLFGPKLDVSQAWRTSSFPSPPVFVNKNNNFYPVYQLLFFVFYVYYF